MSLPAHRDTTTCTIASMRPTYPLTGLAYPGLSHFSSYELASEYHEPASAKNPKLTNLSFQLTKITQDPSRAE